MGLDMFLRGEAYLMPDYSKPEGERREMFDGFEVTTHVLDLGYWRKHPNLHGYIVQQFADGVDRCQQIGLEAADLKKIIEAVEADALPYTTGFFFGTSLASDRALTLAILKRALKWLETESEGVLKSVYYQASW